MKTLVCAIRGGQASKKTQEKAIDIAKERGFNITFLYVIDKNLIEKSDHTIRRELKDEVIKMGRLLLRIARARAKKKEVEADFIIDEGTI
ncbi:MAG: universal stress protein, partial [Candidatus Eremiobacterota bacterium]